MSNARVFRVMGLDRLEKRVLPSQMLGGDNPAAVSAPSTYSWFLPLHEQYLAEAAQGGANVVFLGDSITQQWGAPGAPSWGTAAWNAEMAPLGAQNFGVAADETQNVLWRVENGELVGHPQVAVLMIGTNDFTSGRTPAQTAQGVAAVIQAIQTESPDTRILLMGVLPRAYSPDNPLRQDVERLDALLPALADGSQVRYLDAGAHFLNSNGTLNSADYQPGDLHLTPQGYDVLAAAIAPVLREMIDEAIPMVPAANDTSAPPSSPPPAAGQPSAPSSVPVASSSDSNSPAVAVPVDTTSPDLIVPVSVSLPQDPIEPVATGTDASHKESNDLDAGLSGS